MVGDGIAFPLNIFVDEPGFFPSGERKMCFEAVCYEGWTWGYLEIFGGGIGVGRQGGIERLIHVLEVAAKTD